MSKFRHKEAGEGAAGILTYVAIFVVLYYLGYWILHSFFSWKEGRVERRQEIMLEHSRPKEDQSMKGYFDYQ